MAKILTSPVFVAVMRPRLRATYSLADWLIVGGQVAPGDPDDPNSADITLSNFYDDLQRSLDQAYVGHAAPDIQLHLGKIPQPFVCTDLAWDGAVSLQGASLAYATTLDRVVVKATGLYFMVDEAIAGPDSRMIGGRLASRAPLQAELAIG